MACFAATCANAATTSVILAHQQDQRRDQPPQSGAIAMDGLQLEQIHVEPQIAAYRRMVRDLAFDVCELAPTTYLCAKAFPRFTAIPVSWRVVSITVRSSASRVRHQRTQGSGR